MSVCIDGVFLSQGVLTLQDRAYLLGDGIFTTILYQNGTLELWDLHIGRLQKGMQLFQFSYDLSPCYGWAMTLAKHYEKARIRMTLSRGEGKSGILPQGCHPRLVITISPYTRPETPLFFKISSYLFREKPPLSCIKHTGYQIRILARLEHPDSEVILLNPEGHVVGASCGNIVAKKNGKLVTPPLQDGAIEGVMRTHLLKEGRIQEGTLRVEDLKQDVWLTNALVGMQWGVLVAE